MSRYSTNGRSIADVDLKRQQDRAGGQARRPLKGQRVKLSLRPIAGLRPAGLGSLSWIVTEVNNAHLVPSISGEVDILAGPLEFREPEEFQRALAGQEAERPDWHPFWHKVLAAKKIAEGGGIL